MSIIRRFSSVAAKVPACCFICRRQADAIGVSFPRSSNVVWICTNEYCNHVAGKLLMAPLQLFNEVERRSISDAGEAAGAYLDKIGKTDLATLTPDEWISFLTAFTYGLENAMRLNAMRFAYGENLGIESE